MPEDHDTVLGLRGDPCPFSTDLPNCAPDTVEVLKTDRDKHTGENLGYSARGSNYFHADKHCHRIEGARVIATPISRLWNAVTRYNIPCDDCTVSRDRLEALVDGGAVPDFEVDRSTACEVW